MTLDVNSGFYFNTDIDTDGPTFTPRQPGSTATSAPVPVNTPAPVTATPATTTVIVTAPPAPQPTPRQASTSLPVPDVVGSAKYAAADYAAAAQALFPRGRAWSFDPGLPQAKLLTAVGATLSRVDAAAQGILGGTMPGARTEMLPEWEAALGLPDPCAGANPTLDQRLDQVRGRFVGAGGQSRQHILDFALALGFAISITTYAPFRAGYSAVGQPVAGDEWRFAWGVTVIAKTGALPVDVLICELNAIKPAETALVFLGDQNSILLVNENGLPLLSEDGSPLLA